MVCQKISFLSTVNDLQFFEFARTFQEVSAGGWLFIYPGVDLIVEALDRGTLEIPRDMADEALSTEEDAI